MIYRTLIALFSTSILTGCASTFTSITDRALTADRFNEPHDRNKLITISGPRRYARVYEIANDKGAPVILVCAEPFSGGLVARSANTEFSEGDKFSIKDAITQALTKIDERAERTRTAQDFAHVWCMARSAGMITDKEYVARIDSLQKSAFPAAPPPIPPK